MTDATVRPFLTRLELRPHTYDIDFAGIVSNIVYIRWLEQLRTAMLDEHFPLEDQLRDGYVPVLLETQIRYLRALRLFDRPVGVMWLTHMTRVRFALEAEVELDGKPVAHASHLLAFVRSDDLRPVPIPGEFRRAFERERG